MHRNLTQFNPASRSNSSGKKKKPKQPTIPEGDEESQSTEASRDIDEEQMIAEALEESLGLAGEDPDIAEAKKRLLESKILSPEYFEGSLSPGEYSDDLIGDLYESYDEQEDDDEVVSSDDGESDESQRDEDEERYSADAEGDDNAERDIENGMNGEHRSRNASLVSEVDESFDTATQEVPTESTSLLSSQGNSPSLNLRPSIWTNVASMAQMERTRSMDDEEATKSNENTIADSHHSM